MNGKISLALAGLALSTLTCAGIANSESPAAVATIEARQKGLKALGAAFKLIRDELRDPGNADAGKIKTAAIDIKKAANGIEHWFPAGTGPEAGVKTEAKPEIWSDAQGFATARDAFVREAGKLVELANAGDPAALNEATKALGQACKGCHDSYRVKKKE